jgi:hypothetical protein
VYSHLIESISVRAERINRINKLGGRNILSFKASELRGLHIDDETDALITDMNKRISKLDAKITEGKSFGLSGTGTPYCYDRKLAEQYGSANLATAVSIVGGHTALKGANISTLGIVASKLFPVAHPDAMTPLPGISILCSAQQQLIGFAPGSHVSRTQYGLAAAWQNLVASPQRPFDRWDTQVGFEYVFRAALDQNPTYGLYLRYRPFGHYGHMEPCVDEANGHDTHQHGNKHERYAVDPSRDYAPMEFTLYGGFGPNGRAFIGARAGFAFSL